MSDIEFQFLPHICLMNCNIKSKSHCATDKLFHTNIFIKYCIKYIFPMINW